MHDIEIILGLLVVVAALAAVAHRLDVPYPILLVLGGAALALVPGLPHIELRPELVFLLFLPPLRYQQSFMASWRDLRANARSITLLALGLVLATTLVVGFVAHLVVPGLPLAAGLVLGAIVAPAGAVAASAVAQRLGLPRNVGAVLEGESLVNDASALVAYRMAVAAVVAGTFSLQDAAMGFVASAVGGVVIGLAVGWAVAWLRRRIDDAPVEITISLLTGFAAYLPAEALGVSGVLAVVTCGIVVSRLAPRLMSARARIQGLSTWEMVVFLLNGLLFILIGLQLREVVRELVDYSVLQLLGYVAAVSLAAVWLRLAWVFPGAYVPRYLDEWLGVRSVRYPPWQQVLVVGWSGMRGVVSLAAALALPLTTATGEAFPHRSLIIFLTFAFILVTLVGQGLTLPWLIQRLKVVGDAKAEYEENKARLKLAHAGRLRLEELADADWVNAETIEHLRQHYDERLHRFKTRFKAPEDGSHEARAAIDARLQQEVLLAEREMLIRLRDQDSIDDEIHWRIQREIDLEESRLPA